MPDAVRHVRLDGLTPAQARALSRCVPLSRAEFKARGRVADKGLLSLREVVDHPRADVEGNVPEG